MRSVLNFLLIGAIAHVAYSDDERVANFRDDSEDIRNTPYMAQILCKGKFLCGGTIRAKNWILTAAHCFDRMKSISDFEILTGTSSRGGLDGQRHKIKRVLLHLNYNQNDEDAQDDIALVELEEPMEFSDVQRSIKIAPIGVKRPEFVKVTSFKYDDDFSEDDREYFPKVQSKVIPVIERNECQKHFEDRISPNVFCARSMESYICEGDSGSPAVDEVGRLLGIVSKGKDCNFKTLEKAPGIFTKVSHYVSWLDEKTRMSSVYQ